jgi:hypothetical protein
MDADQFFSDTGKIPMIGGPFDGLRTNNSNALLIMINDKQQVTVKHMYVLFLGDCAVINSNTEDTYQPWDETKLEYRYGGTISIA